MKQITIILLILSSMFCKAQDTLIIKGNGDTILITPPYCDKCIHEGTIVVVDSVLEVKGNAFKLLGLDSHGRMYIWTTRSKGLGKFPRDYYLHKIFIYCEAGF